jgi:hypothetical protein
MSQTMAESATIEAGDGVTDEGSEDDTEGVPIPRDELFHLLQNERRRAVVRYLRGVDGPVSMREVAEQVAAWEHGTTVAALTSDQRQRVYIALYQSHLDALDAAGVVEYNKPRGVVEPTPLVEYVAGYVESAGPPEQAAGPGGWEQWYLGVSLVGAVLLMASRLEGGLLGPVSSFLVGALVLAAVTVLTLARFPRGPDAGA